MMKKRQLERSSQSREVTSAFKASVMSINRQHNQAGTETVGSQAACTSDANTRANWPACMCTHAHDMRHIQHEASANKRTLHHILAQVKSIHSLIIRAVAACSGGLMKGMSAKAASTVAPAAGTAVAAVCGGEHVVVVSS